MSELQKEKHLFNPSKAFALQHEAVRRYSPTCVPIAELKTSSSEKKFAETELY
jgi:hypothetical protein